MANTINSLKAFLEERDLTRKKPTLLGPRARQRLEESELLKSMREVCGAINSQAGTVVVDEHHYLPPEPVISSFAYSKGATEYVMRLELGDRKPSLVFVTRKWRNASTSGFLRWVYRLAEVEPLRVNFNCSYEIEEGDASFQEIERCFYFLLTGLDRRYRPSFRPSKESRPSMPWP